MNTYFRLQSAGTHATGGGIATANDKVLKSGDQVLDNTYLFRIDADNPCPLGDLMCIGRSPLVVSEAAAEVLRQFTFQENTQSFPVTVLECNLDDEGDIESESAMGTAVGFLFDWPVEAMEDADAQAYKKQSRLTYGDPHPPIPVLRAELIPTVDILSCRRIGILVSGPVKSAIEEAQLENFRLLPVELK